MRLTYMNVNVSRRLNKQLYIKTIVPYITVDNDRTRFYTYCATRTIKGGTNSWLKIKLTYGYDERCDGIGKLNIFLPGILANRSGTLRG